MWHLGGGWLGCLRVEGSTLHPKPVKALTWGFGVKGCGLRIYGESGTNQTIAKAHF